MAQLRKLARVAWGRHSCLRNHNPRTMNCAPTHATQIVAQAGVGLCASAVDVAFACAFDSPPLTSSRGPFTGRRISLRFDSRSNPNVTATPVVSHSTISNRSARRLEMPETYTKQRTDPLSNRHKFTQPWGRHSREFAANPLIHTERAQRALECALRNAARASKPCLRIAPNVESGTGWSWPVYLLPCGSLHLNRRPDTIASPAPDTRFRLPSTRAKIANT
jgi:hypothetical protein